MSILILAEHDGKQLKQSTRQAVTAAAAWSLPIHLLVVGHNSGEIAKQAAEVAGVAKVLHAEAAHYEHALAEDVAALLLQIGRDYKVILSAHTAFSKSVLPRVAALLDVGMVSDAISITAPATYVRPIYAGNVLSTVESSDAIQVVTIRATSFAVPATGGNAEIAAVAATASTGLSRWIKEDKNVSDRPELSSARVVVSGGRSWVSALMNCWSHWRTSLVAPWALPVPALMLALPLTIFRSARLVPSSRLNCISPLVFPAPCSTWQA